MAQKLSDAANTVAPAGRIDDLYFNTERLKTGLGVRTARGGAVTFASQAFKFCAGLGATMVLGRLLRPSDYGLIGMVVVVTGFVSMFKDLGLSAATVQREEITSEQVSTLFWVNVALSIGVGLITVALAPAVAWFYGEPKLLLITMVYAFGFLFGGLTVQHEALLHRQMRFAAQAACEIVALIITIAVTITLAWRGAGYWALVAGHLTTSFVYMLLIWTVCGWHPGPPSRNSGVRSLLHFGGNLTGFGVVNFFARNLDNLLIGRVWGSQQLGLYAKAYQLLTLPIDQINAPITTVAVPALSRLNDSPERYRGAYLRIIEKISVLTMPGVALLIATADWVVLVALGPQWTQAGQIFAALGVAALIQPIANTTGWLFISQGRTRDMFRYGMVASTIIVTAILVGLPWGAPGVATSYALVWVIIITPLLFYWVGRTGPVRPRDFYVTVAPAFCAALGVLVALFLFRRSGIIVNPLAGLVTSFGIACGVALVILFAIPAGRRALLDFTELVKKILPNSFKDKIKNISRERRLEAAIRRLVLVPKSEPPPPEILAELARAWGDDGFRAVGGYLEEVTRRAADEQRPVLEIGSGLTTLILGALLHRRDLPVWTLEHHPEYFRQTEARLRRCGLTNVHLILAPLRDYGDFCWYDPPLDALPRDFGLVVADGPPGDVKGGRFGLLPVLRSHFARGVVILLDDAERLQERVVLEKWASEYGLSHQSYTREGKAWAICTF